MRKLMMYILACAIFFSPGCFLDDDSDEDPTGTAKLTAKVTYNGTEGGPDDLYIFVYSALSQNAPRTGIVYQNSVNDISAGTEYTITIENITAGTYYIVALYDYHSGGANIITKTDRYEIYNASGGTQLVAGASAVTFSENQTVTITMDQDSWRIVDADPITFMSI